MTQQEFFKKIAAEAAQGELAFSTGAQVALKVRRALDDPDCHIDAAAKLIQAEPLLAARIVAIANSIAYNRSGREVSDIKVAVTRLGFKTVRALAMALVTKQMAGSNPKHRHITDQLWEHTAHVASLAQMLARHITHQDPEAAMFAGLIHEVGGFYLISRAESCPGLLDGSFDEWVEFGEVEVNRAVVEKLGVPDTIAQAMAGYWDGYLGMPPVTLADTILLAEELAPIPSPLHKLKDVADAEAAKASIEMVIGQETLSGILKESADEVSSLTDALKF